MKKTGGVKTSLIVVVNVFLIVVGIFFTMFYAGRLTAERTETAKDSFRTTVEAMTRVTLEQLSMQQEYANSWSSYITESNMTMEEAMSFLGEICDDGETEAQIIDTETFTGYSTKENPTQAGDYSVDYSKYSAWQKNAFLETVQNGSDDYIYIPGTFTHPNDGSHVVAFGHEVALVTSSGRVRNFLLLRLIKRTALQEQFVFPTEYPEAEISLISENGDYIIRSDSMKSENFFEFIRAYNDLTYPQMDEIEQEVASSGSGILTYRNARGVDSYYIYTGLEEDYGNWMLVAYIPVESLQSYGTDWFLILSVAGILLALLLIDGVYFVSINRQLRRRTEEAKQASEAKTRFLSSMSHDIRTPMNAIIGMTAIAKARIDDKERVENALNKISGASNHLLTLINDILDISRIESGRLVLNPTAVSLSAEINKLCDLVRVQVNAKNLNLTVNRVDLTEDCLYADALRLNQIFLNILSNAVKYTPPEGSITITVKEIPVDDTHVRLIYTVTDTGIGIEEEFLKTIFEPFTRAKDLRIDTVEGSGLGMAIVKQMSEAMGGTVSVESKVGEGSTFTVELPLPIVTDAADGESEANGQTVGGEQISLAGMHLLVAEDNELNWEIIHELLDYEGVSTDHAENGRVCVQMLSDAPEGTYDAVLMDVRMPIMNGLEAARAIRAIEEPGMRTIPIIAMTADAFAEDVHNCLEAGMNDHVAKPVNMKLLKIKLNKLVPKKEEKE